MNLRQAIDDEIRSLNRLPLPLPAWKLLLALGDARLDMERISITTAAYDAGIPPTTALRWTGLLIEWGLASRAPDKADERRTWLAITEEGMNTIAAYFNNGLRAVA